MKDLDPTVERIILRCLEEEPKRRPSSALNVAIALPGADPIAAALASASGEKEGFSPRTAARCFAAVLVLLALTMFVSSPERGAVLALAPLEIPPDGLAFRAQDILKQLGYTEKPRTTAYGFKNLETGYLSYLQQHNPANRDELLASHQPPVTGFWYRQFKDDFVANTFFARGLLSGIVTYNAPPNGEPGMTRLILDAKGRLFAGGAAFGKRNQQPAVSWGHD